MMTMMVVQGDNAGEAGQRPRSGEVLAVLDRLSKFVQGVVRKDEHPPLSEHLIDSWRTGHTMMAHDVLDEIQQIRVVEQSRPRDAMTEQELMAAHAPDRSELIGAAVQMLLVARDIISSFPALASETPIQKAAARLAGALGARDVAWVLP